MTVNTDETVTWKIISRMKDQLEADLKTAIATADSARVTYLQLGKFNRDPTGINLAIFATHPKGTSMGRLAFPGNESSSAFVGARPGWFPEESIGGSLIRYVVGTVVIYSLLDHSPADNIQVIECVKTRIANCINNDSGYLTLSDTYGWHCVMMRTAEWYGYASGGDDVALDRHYCDWVAAISAKRVH